MKTDAVEASLPLNHQILINVSLSIYIYNLIMENLMYIIFLKLNTYFIQYLLITKIRKENVLCVIRKLTVLTFQLIISKLLKLVSVTKYFFKGDCDFLSHNYDIFPLTIASLHLATDFFSQN